ncbi:PP2C family protein-serine/threonine phosphatase [Aquabacterium sp.]|uniref:PP2C family protein-serine/threonine phosphatase n=1 Tax=Aquabacterium sp. TaxID=1872578 RepID=UPI002C504252|nr:PP2C family protein-serine/threonine phosphatase [Aquabacterium sp.]HSW05509.1 PP2C family protein-serine/threonine phosphatase [Aquabacterium sp.]
MALHRRLLSFWAVALVAVGAIVAVAALLREAQWRERLDGMAQIPLQQAWNASAAQAQATLSARLDEVQRLPELRAAGSGAATIDAAQLADRLARAAAAAGLVQVDLYDSHRQWRASSAASPADQPLADVASLLAMAQPSDGAAQRADISDPAQRVGIADPAQHAHLPNPTQYAGVRLREAGRERGGGPALYVLARRLDDGSVLAAALDLRPLLLAAERQLGRPLALTSPRGLLLAGLPPARAQRHTLALPGLAGVDGRPAALLLAARPDDAAAPPLGWLPGTWLAAIPLVFVLGLASAWRRLLAPLLGSARLVEALADGQLQAAADDADTLAPTQAGGEACRLARAAERLRTELRALDALRDERQRVAAQQTRLIREQLRALADMLDAAGRNEILAQLGDEGTGDGRPQLARLATLLARLTSLVGTQQGRLLGLLRELQESVRTRELFASLQQELAIARRLQQAILPRGAPPVPQVAIEATMIPAREVGGDFYDWFMLDERRLALVVADVSGKGVPAAFFMAITRTLLRSAAAFVSQPAQLLARLNDALAAENDETLFVTLFYAVLDVETGQLDSVNAGHNPPLLRRADGRVESLPSGRNPVLAAVPGLQFQADRCRLAPGDGLLLYTDGITEAQDAAGALFGEAALVTALAAAGPQPVQALVDAVRAFENGAPQADDISCVWLRYAPE